jgi:predicted HAD superfamily Cof-like phosphohydrolase
MRQESREDLVRRFAEAMGQSTDVENPSINLIQFRQKLILEEVAELGDELVVAMGEAMLRGKVSTETKIKILKELADVQYVVSGLAVAFGLPLEQAFVRVHNSNMSKLDENGKPIYRDDGKVLKGPNYTPPNLQDLFISEPTE